MTVLRASRAHRRRGERSGAVLLLLIAYRLSLIGGAFGEQHKGESGRQLSCGVSLRRGRRAGVGQCRACLVDATTSQLRGTWRRGNDLSLEEYGRA